MREEGEERAGVSLRFEACGKALGRSGAGRCLGFAGGPELVERWSGGAFSLPAGRD